MSDELSEIRNLVMRAHTTWTDTGIPRVSMVRAEMCSNQVYRPALHIVLQGSKTLFVGDRILNFDSASYFLAPVYLPATGQVKATDSGDPYLAVSLSLDSEVVEGLIDKPEEMVASAKSCIFSTANLQPQMINALARLLRLMDSPEEVSVLAPMIEREILFRVLQGPLAQELREFIAADGRLAGIRKAAQWTRDNFTESFRVESLAMMANVSVAAFYRQFKEVTAMTPIQYQKRIRLLKARWMIILDRNDTATAAYAVGYESSSQFSREYKRFFGVTPSFDMNSVTS